MTKRRPADTNAPPATVPAGPESRPPGASTLDLIRAWDAAQYASFQPAEPGPSRLPAVGESLAGFVQFPAVRDLPGARLACEVRRTSATDIRLAWTEPPPFALWQTWRPWGMSVGAWTFPAVPTIRHEAVFQDPHSGTRPVAAGPPRSRRPVGSPVAAAASDVPRPWIWKTPTAGAVWTLTQARQPDSQLEGTIAWPAGPGHCWAVLEFEFEAEADGAVRRGARAVRLEALPNLSAAQTHRLQVRLPELFSPGEGVTLQLRSMSAAMLHDWQRSTVQQDRLDRAVVPLMGQADAEGLTLQARYADQRQVVNDATSEWTLVVVPGPPAQPGPPGLVDEGLR